MYLIHRHIAVFVAANIIMTTVLPPPAFSDGWRRKPTSIERLAHSIDRLEKHLDEYGTVVVKSPDVWGEARLTKFRQEYESTLEKKLEHFSDTINATISRSDKAFVTNALALQAAVSSRSASIIGSPFTTSTTTATPVLQPGLQTPAINQSVGGFTLSLPSSALQVPVRDALGNPVVNTSTVSTSGSTSQPLSIPAAADDSLISTPQFSSTTQQTDSIAFEKDKIALEPTVMLDQLSRYVNHLHQLRRISDGDDKSDAPGYALHLVRLPVSVLPGKKTREGYGAEVTVIAKPHLHEKLLPETFRGLVINDLVDQWSFPLAKFLDQEDAEDILAKAAKPPMNPDDIEIIEKELGTASDALQTVANTPVTHVIASVAIAHYEKAQKAIDTAKHLLITAKAGDATIIAQLSELSAEIGRQICIAQGYEVTVTELKRSTPNFEYRLDNALKSDKPPTWLKESRPVFEGIQHNLQSIKEERGAVPQQDLQPDSYEKLTSVEEEYVNKAMAAAKVFTSNAARFNTSTRQLVNQAKESVNKLSVIGESIKELQSVFTVPSLSTTPSRRSQQPFPITLAFDVHSGSGLVDVAKQMLSIKEDDHNKSALLLLDVQKILAEEFNAAYDFLNSHNNGQLWSHCTPQMEAAVRQKDGGTLKLLRGQFQSQIAVSDTAPTPLNHLSDRQRFTVALAWAIIVESALLNERLVEDIAHLASAKNAHHLRTDWLPYYGPHPPIDAVMAFNDYVCCRWPIHVVAIDPVTQDQNVADSFSQRRELQLALSLAFASGRIDAQNFTRMARQLELDMETVSLNRTSVGFSHGDNTFGWRFQPRIQSPDTKGNIRTFAETLFTGGSSRDSILKQSRLEPGTRECTAIVIMPSFVPYVLFDMRTNWFRLTDPSKKEFDLHDGMELSAEVVELHQLSQQCVSDQNKYRHGDVHRLMRSVDQLETRLPLQTKYVQMPFENSLGGFEFFNSGTPDLAPELKGYYGEPGLSQEHKTTIFLVGDHFSVHETKVIVGGQSVKAKLLSRQVMEITVDPVFNVLNKNVDIHVATPYGVSNHIDVPVIPKTASTAVAEAIAKHEENEHLDQFQWAPEEVRIQMMMDTPCHVSGVGILDNIVVKNGKKLPFDEYKHVELRAWVSTLSKADGAEPVRVNAPLVIPKQLLGKGKPLIEQENLAKAVQVLFQNGGLPMDTEKLIVEAYLAFTDGMGVSQIVKIDNDLTLNVEICCGACKPTPAAAPVVPAVPETEVAPATSLVPPTYKLQEPYQMQHVNTRASQLLTIPPSQLR